MDKRHYEFVRNDACKNYLLKEKHFSGINLFQDDSAVMIVDENDKSSELHLETFTARATPAHEYAAALAKGTINGLNNAGLAFAF